MNRSNSHTWIIFCLFTLAGCYDHQRNSHPTEGDMEHVEIIVPDPSDTYSDSTSTLDFGSGVTPDVTSQKPFMPATSGTLKTKKRERKKDQAYDQETIDQRIASIRQMKARESYLDLEAYRQVATQGSRQSRHLNEYLYLKNPNNYLTVNFENDIFTNRDWYYTNGVRIEFISPVLNRSVLNILMLPYKKQSSNYYGLAFVHRMYTPKDPHIDSVTVGDRPFSSYAYLGFFKMSNSFVKRYRQVSSLNIGLIGSAAMGKSVQEIVHYSELTGWDHQVENDLVLDYHVRMEKGLLTNRYIEAGGLFTANVGTLYDKIGAGPYLIAGLYDPATLESISEDTWSQNNPANEKAQCFLYYRFITYLVGYDATLQGGLFNNSTYALPPGQIERFTFENRLGLTLSYKWIAFHAEYVWLTPEYDGCVPHRWMRYNLTFLF